MSQELVGNCGAIVGSTEYFQQINRGAIFAPFLDCYQYSSAIGQLCSRCASVLDEIYSDMRGVPTTVFALPEEQKENLRKIITNLDEAASFLFPAYTCANACRAMLEIDTPESDSGIGSIWSHDIGSNGYIQSKCSSIFQSILADPFSSISLTIISDLTNIAQQIAADIDYGLDANYYMRDENGAALQSAINELERCNCMALSSHHSKIGKLCWYQDVSRDQVLTLQKALNKIPEFGTLTEDGVYGEKTSNIWNNFMDTLAHGSFPSLTIINPLQTDLTGIRIQSFPKKKKVTQGLIQNLPGSKLPDSYWQSFLLDGRKEGNQSLFYFDAPHDKHNYYHWNYHNSRNSLIPLDDHVAITEDAFLKLAHFEKGAKVVKIAGRILLVADIALDALEIGSTMYADLNDADGRLGRTTITTVASIAGEWGGSIAGAKLGAMAGAAAGTAILPGIGTAVSGLVIGLIGGVAGAVAGDARWLASGLHPRYHRCRRVKYVA